jgi:deoxyribonuclease (pyrimidine dimer)
MVRVNLLNPKKLMDQHLIAEYDEILMLIGYIKRYPSLDEIPTQYCLGKGHMKFFKDKLLYLKDRHELLKKEMLRRKFKPTKEINLIEFKKQNLNNWTPNKYDKKIIKQRIILKLMKKPKYYRYYGKHIPLKEMINMIEN